MVSPICFPASPLPGDEYIITSGGLKGQRGFFTRDPDGQATGADLAGRKFTRLSAVQG
jgi:hypothetical protein